MIGHVTILWTRIRKRVPLNSSDCAGYRTRVNRNGNRTRSTFWATQPAFTVKMPNILVNLDEWGLPVDAPCGTRARVFRQVVGVRIELTYVGL